MKKNLFVVFLSLFVSACFGQITFQKYYGNGGYTQQTSDGGYIISGGNCLIKVDSIGDTLWSKNFNSNRPFHSVNPLQTFDGGYIIGGTYGDYLMQTDFFLIKTDANGNVIWNKTYGNGDSSNYCNAITQTTDSGFVMVGETWSSTTHYDYYVIKTNLYGDTLWTKTFGDQGMEYARSVTATNDGGFIIGGSYGGIGGDPTCAFIVKINANGNTQWFSCFQDVLGAGGTYVYCNSIEQCIDGGYVLAGYQTRQSHASDALLFKTDSNGNLQWQKTFGVGYLYNVANSVMQTTDGGFIITGRTGSYNSFLYNAFLTKTDSVGNLIWGKNYGDTLGSTGNANTVQQTFDGGYILGGNSLIKTDSMGDISCLTTHSGVGLDSMGLSLTGVLGLTSIPSFIISSTSLSIGGGTTVYTPCFNVGIEKPDSIHSFTIFPNPSHNSFTIELLAKGMNEELEIYNTLGEKVYSTTLKGKQQTFNNKFPSGIYFVKVSDGENQIVEKLIVQ